MFLCFLSLLGKIGYAFFNPKSKYMENVWERHLAAIYIISRAAQARRTGPNPQSEIPNPKSISLSFELGPSLLKKGPLALPYIFTAKGGLGN